MRYVAAAIIILAGATAVGLGSISEHGSLRADTAQNLGLALVVAGVVVFGYDFRRELLSQGPN